MKLTADGTNTVAPANPTAQPEGPATTAPPATPATTSAPSGNQNPATQPPNQNPATQPSNQNPTNPNQNPSNPTPNNQMPNQNNFMPPWAGNTGFRGSMDQLWGMTMNVGLELGNIVNNVFSGTFNAVGSLFDSIFGMGVLNGQNTATYNNQIG